MNASLDSIPSAAYQDGFIIVKLEGGATIRFPSSESPRLCLGTAEQLELHASSLEA